jgi:peptidoglycan hydrolase FlgJ
MSLPLVDPSSLADAGNLTALKEAAAAHNPQALREAARQFESLFTSMVLKSMRQANFSDSLFGSDQENMYQDMYDDQIAAEISKGRGLGLADMLVQQLRRSGLAGTTAASATAPTTATTSTASSSATLPPAAAAVSPNAVSCPSTTQQLQFAQSLWPQAQQAAQQLGVSPVSLVAQAALETDWGRSVPRSASGSSSNNLFGIKADAAWSGASVQSATQEYTGGTATAVKAQFRAYSTPSQCFKDYVSLLQSNPRYAAALGTGGNTQAFAAALQRGGYATDPSYAGKLGAVATTLTRALRQGGRAAAVNGSLSAALLKSAGVLPTTSGSNTL